MLSTVLKTFARFDILATTSTSVTKCDTSFELMILVFSTSTACVYSIFIERVLT